MLTATLCSIFKKLLRYILKIKFFMFAYKLYLCSITQKLQIIDYYFFKYNII